MCEKDAKSLSYCNYKDVIRGKAVMRANTWQLSSYSWKSKTL